MPTLAITELPKTLFLRDPLESPLGKRILTSSIELLHSDGFEQFTFKKVALKTKTTEASVYRYFENKYQLLSYLVCWYWGWLAFRYRVRSQGERDNWGLLKVALSVLCESNIRDDSIPHVDESKLHQVVVADGNKSESFMAQIGTIRSSEVFANILSELITKVSPSYPWPITLAHSVISSAQYALHHMQIFDSGKEQGTVSNIGELLELLEDWLKSTLTRQSHN